MYLEAVIDEPLERSQSTDHSNSNRETVPEAPEADIAVDSRHGLAAALTSCHNLISTIPSRESRPSRDEKTHVAYQRSTC